MVSKRFLQHQENNDISEMSHQHNQTTYTLRILRMRDLVQKTGMSRAFLYEKFKKGSKNFDPHCPPKITLGGKSVGFLESDVDKWLLSLAEKSFANTGDSV